MTLSTNEMLARVARRLAELGDDVVFVGGATIALYLDELGAAEARHTMDVDCVVPIETLADYSRLEDRLRRMGFRHRAGPGDPICRWVVEGVIVDVMPFVEEVLGFTNRFYRAGHASAREVTLPQGSKLRIMTAEHALATKIEAFRHRGDDPYESRDLEDIVALVDGHAGLLDAVAGSEQEVRHAVAAWTTELLADPDHVDVLEGHLPRGVGFDERVRRLVVRLASLAALR